MKNSLFFAFLLFNNLIFCQGEGNFWYFGSNAGIDFNNGGPTAITNGSVNSFEGCATISDSVGTLLFYTDGVSVYNANHIVMPNGTGLDGHDNSTQSSIIIRKPGSYSIFYIFTTGHEGSISGLKYTEVDMSLQGGLGDVTSNVNQALSAPTCEKLVAIRHQNTVDFWIVAHDYGSNNYLSYLVSSSGISTTPVISSVGSTLSGNFINTIGQLKSNRAGDRIANALYFLDEIELFDFDNSTGLLTNPINFTTGTDCYGVEFSPNGELLYTTWNPGTVAQYNLLAGSGSANDIQSSMTNLGVFLFDFITALQIAPDDKIYAAVDGSTTLAVISDPNTLGAGCNFNISGFNLGGQTSQLGLPNFQNTFAPGIQTVFEICIGDTINLSNNNNSIYNWANSDAPTTIISQAPILQVSPSLNSSYILYGDVDTVTYTVNVGQLPSFTLGNDTSICFGGNVFKNLNCPNCNYLWSNGSTATVNIFDTEGIYWVDVSNNCGTVRDSIIITVFENSQVDLGTDTTVCNGVTLTLNAYTTSNANYLWYDNATDSVAQITVPGVYWVKVTDSIGCIDRDTINVNYDPTPSVNLGNDTTLCAGEILVLDASNSNSIYFWQNNASTTNSIFEVSSAGTYWVSVEMNLCSASDTILVDFFQIDNSLSVSDITLSANLSAAQYQWLDCDNNYATIPNETNQNYTATANGNYALEITGNGCTDTSACVNISTVGIGQTILNQIQIYPNPTYGQVNLELGNLKNVSINIYNVNEQLVYQSEKINSPIYQFEFDYPTGIYFIELNSEGETIRFKLLKE
ncbi:MAG: T9SS type A sorting domain-containing protein [Crocinitomicaceae bacterium]